VAPAHLIPQDIHLLSEMPKNANGKIDRSLLKNEYARS
jgi:acyl-coenzyme A synthetase/AMP-(fatty) acid ligase